MALENSSRFTFAATGDSLLTRRISATRTPAFRAVLRVLSEADVAFTNLEFTVPGKIWHAAPKSNGINMTMHIGCEPFVLDELSGVGFNLFSGANNHAVDYNYPGLVNTVEELEARNMPCAGIGRNLYEASEPKYLQVGDRRVAIVAAASTYTYGAYASRARGAVEGRPGLNPLRFSSEYQLDPAHWEMLLAIDQALPTARLTAQSREVGLLRDKGGGEYRFLNQSFVQGDICDIITRANAEDIRRVELQIREAKRQADFVVVSLHAHEGLHGDSHSEEPAEFIREAAHTLLDAGADIFIGHGPHLLRPLEVYRGKAIFYSLGNFFFTIESLEKLPAESFEQHGLSEQATCADVHDLWCRKADGSPAVFMTSEKYWQTLLPVCEFEGDRLSHILLYPIVLGQNLSRGCKGVPMLADWEAGTEILDRFEHMSSKYGVRFERMSKDNRVLAKVDIPEQKSQE